jgi:hypothetical protein
MEARSSNSNISRVVLCPGGRTQALLPLGLSSMQLLTKRRREGRRGMEERKEGRETWIPVLA